MDSEQPNLDAIAVSELALRDALAVDEDRLGRRELAQGNAGGMACQETQDRWRIGADAEVTAGGAADEEIDFAQCVEGRARAALTYFELHVGQPFRPVGGRDSSGRGRHSDNLRRWGGSFHEPRAAHEACLHMTHFAGKRKERFGDEGRKGLGVRGQGLGVRGQFLIHNP